MIMRSISHGQPHSAGGGHRFTGIAAFAAIALLLQACGSTGAPHSESPRAPHTSGNQSAHRGAPAPAPSKTQYDIVGIASWYGKPFHGRRTASGAVYNMYQMTAAHPSLPFGTRVSVTNLANGRTVVVTINDRGPFIRGRIIDVSRKAASQLGFIGNGLTRVGVRVVSSSRG